MRSRCRFRLEGPVQKTIVSKGSLSISMLVWRSVPVLRLKRVRGQLTGKSCKADIYKALAARSEGGSGHMAPRKGHMGRSCVWPIVFRIVRFVSGGT